MRALKPLIFALMIACLSAPALAANQPMTGSDTSAAIAKTAYLSAAELDEIEALPQEDRAAFLKEKHEAFQALSPEERAAKQKERSDAFNALPAAEQQTIKERTIRLIGAKDAAPAVRDIAAEQAEAKQEAEEFVRNLPPDQKARWEEIRRNSKLWEDSQKKAPAKK